MKTKKQPHSRKGVCPECKRVTPAGRSDKRFCSDSCRISFNNNRRRLGMANKGYRVIQQALRVNRDVLSAFHFVKTEWVSKEELERYGFDFKYFTHVSPIDHGKQLNFVFEFGYEVANNGYVRLHKDSDGNSELPLE